ncbi:hypothetical protein SEA_NICEHOUSE_171 [Rhodococcus phage NiceHouse]|nr:hypothetical protein SEA_NICEHOUSE_171 [Rhodococcus phage NiceHouse]
MPTSAQFVEAVRKIAKENKDYIYRDNASACVYFDWETETGSCIIGKASEELGLTKLDFPGQKNHKPISDNLGIFSDYSPIQAGQDFWDNIRWLGNVQHEQDMGRSWGAAVIVADGLAKDRDI